MDSKKILYISQEIRPYVDDSEIATTSRQLPQFVQESGQEVRIFMPRYGLVNERRNQLHEVIRLSGLNLIINDTDHPLIIKVASIPQARMQVYFIDNDDFFKRKSKFEIDGKPHKDNDERSIFFVRGAFETIKKLLWIPDIIHCHGAFTALALIYLKHVYHDDPCLSKAKIVYSLYTEERAVEMSQALFEKLHFDKITDDLLVPMQGQTDAAALNRLAVAYADGLVRGSRELSPEMEKLLSQTSKPVLSYQEEVDTEAYDVFYNQVLQSN
ncbi:MAG: glycogen/starch synthase [Porphyromonas sp.]|nr:glycogen/starch synthase [Porphyromonas sp.]